VVSSRKSFYFYDDEQLNLKKVADRMAKQPLVRHQHQKCNQSSSKSRLGGHLLVVGAVVMVLAMTYLIYKDN